MAQRLLSIEETAQRLGVGRSTTKTLIGKGRLKSVRLGSRRLIPEGSVDELIASLEREAVTSEFAQERAS